MVYNKYIASQTLDAFCHKLNKVLISTVACPKRTQTSSMSRLLAHNKLLYKFTVNVLPCSCSWRCSRHYTTSDRHEPTVHATPLCASLYHHAVHTISTLLHSC